MDDFALLVDLHGEGERRGPAGNEETRLAVTLSGLRGERGQKIADMGQETPHLNRCIRPGNGIGGIVPKAAPFLSSAAGVAKVIIEPQPSIHGLAARIRYPKILGPKSRCQELLWRA